MAFREILLPWDSQPQEAVSASDDALLRGLVHLSFGDFEFDYAVGRATQLSLISGAVSTVPTQIGLGRQNTGASSNNQTRQVIANGDFTILYVGSATSTSTRYAMYQNGSAGEVAVGLNFNDQFAATSASGRMSITMLQTGVNRSHAYVASAIGATEELKAYVWRKRGTSISAWINGVPQTVVTSGGFTGSPTASADIFRATGTAGDGGKRWSGPTSTGIIVATAVYNAAQSDDYCAWLSSLDAFNQALLEPQRILVPVAAAGGTDATATGTTQTATASLLAGAATGEANATATGQTLSATSSLLAGAATGEINATASGVTISATASLLAGAAVGAGVPVLSLPGVTSITATTARPRVTLAF